MAIDSKWYWLGGALAYTGLIFAARRIEDKHLSKLAGISGPRLGRIGKEKLALVRKTLNAEIRKAKAHNGGPLNIEQYEDAARAALRKIGMDQRFAVQPNDVGVELFEFVDGEPFVDHGAQVRYLEGLSGRLLNKGDGSSPKKELGAVDTKLIKRVAQLQSYDMSKLAIREQLVAEGISDDDIFNAYQAAKIYLKRQDRELDDDGSLKGPRIIKATITATAPNGKKWGWPGKRVVREEGADGSWAWRPGAENVGDETEVEAAPTEEEMAKWPTDDSLGSSNLKGLKSDDFQNQVAIALTAEWGFNSEQAAKFVQDNKQLVKHMLDDDLPVDVAAKTLLFSKSKGGIKRFHQKRDISDDEWDVIADALEEASTKSLKKAAKLYIQLQKEHGFVMGNDAFNKAFRALPLKEQFEFHGYTSDLMHGKDLGKANLGARERVLSEDEMAYQAALRKAQGLKPEPIRMRKTRNGNWVHAEPPHSADAAWAVASDALDEGKLQQAAKLYVQIRKDHNMDLPSQAFDDAFFAMTPKDRQKFNEYIREEWHTNPVITYENLGSLRSPDSDQMYEPAMDALKLADDEADPIKRRDLQRKAKVIIDHAKAQFPAEPIPVWLKKWADKKLAPKKTFPQAQADIYTDLRQNNWTVSSNLKIPHATSPDGRLRLWFKPQAVYFTHTDHGERHDYHNARSISYDLDIRKMTPERFRVAMTNNMAFRNQGRTDV